MADEKFLDYRGLSRVISNMSRDYAKNGHQHVVSDIQDFPEMPKFLGDLINDMGYVTTDFNTTYELVQEEDGTVILRGSDGSETRIKITASEGSQAVTDHNTALDSHEDIRRLILEVSERLHTLANSDDETLDQMGEVVAYIKSNKELIEAVTTAKIGREEIADNLVTNNSAQVLSAAQGVVLKSMIDALAALIGEESVGSQVERIVQNLPSISNDTIDRICGSVTEESVSETDIDELIKELK